MSSRSKHKDWSDEDKKRSVTFVLDRFGKLSANDFIDLSKELNRPIQYIDDQWRQVVKPAICQSFGSSTMTATQDRPGHVPSAQKGANDKKRTHSAFDARDERVIADASRADGSTMTESRRKRKKSAIAENMR